LHAGTTCIFVCELVGSRKPEAAIFLAAAACLHLAPERILFVGDTPEADIVGAHRVGMRTAWVRRTDRAWPRHLAVAACDLTITTLAELLPP
jgi:FMN phosphatase YigB (HAD superfamily)